MIDSALIAGISGIILAVVALLNGVSQSRKSAVEGASDVVSAATTLVGPLGERVAVLENKVLLLTEERDTLKIQLAGRDNKISRLEAKVELLTTQIVAMGHKPFDVG